MFPLQKIILLSAKIHPSEAELQALDEQVALVHHWEEASCSLIERGLGPLFYSKLPLLANGALIPAVSKEKLKQAYYITLSRGMMLYEVFRKAVSVLRANDIDLIVLKGAYLAEKLYGDIALRQFSDIDLLIREQDGEKAQAVLKEAGFTSNDFSLAAFIRQHVGFEHYPQLVFQGGAIELHVRLNRTGEQFQIQTESVWKNVQKLSLQGIEVNVPNLPDLLIHTCVHLHKHFQEGEIQFTGFNDIVNLLDIHADKINWEEFTERCRQYHCEEIVFTYLLLTSKYYQLSLPENIVTTYGHCLQPDDEELFLSYLSGFKSKHYAFASRLKRLQKLNGLRLKTKYLLLMLFPSKKHIIRSFNIKKSSLFWLYYPLWYWIGVKGVWRMMWGKL